MIGGDQNDGYVLIDALVAASLLAIAATLTTGTILTSIHHEASEQERLLLTAWGRVAAVELSIAPTSERAIAFRYDDILVEATRSDRPPGSYLGAWTLVVSDTNREHVETLFVLEPNMQKLQ